MTRKEMIYHAALKFATTEREMGDGIRRPPIYQAVNLAVSLVDEIEKKEGDTK